MLLRGAEHLAEESVKQAQVGSMAHRAGGRGGRAVDAVQRHLGNLYKSL